MSTFRSRIPKAVTFCLVIIFLMSMSFALQAEFKPDKKYVVGIEAAFPPWAMAEKGEYKGIAVDAIRKIAEVKDIKIEIRDLPWPSLIPALGAGKIDILATGLSVTCERDKKIDFSIPWWGINLEVLVKEDSDLNAYTAVCCGNTVATQAGSTSYHFVQENLVKNFNVKNRGYESFVTAVDDVETGRADAMITDTDTAEKFAAKRPVKIVGTIHRNESYALAVTEDDPYDLLPKLNDGIKKIYNSGEWAEIVHKYMPNATIKSIPTSMLGCIETY